MSQYLKPVLNQSVSEDCLFLNIWSPHQDLIRLPNRTNKVQSDETLLPVVVFIHGGTFNYTGGVVAALGKVVFVSVNHRLGVFGFFQARLPETMYPRNVGLFDLVAAIEWIRDNIRYFGGK